MRDGTSVPGSTVSGQSLGGVDQVDAARDWLRRHGIDTPVGNAAGGGGGPRTATGGQSESEDAPGERVPRPGASSPGRAGVLQGAASATGGGRPRHADPAAAAGRDEGGSHEDGSDEDEADADPEEVARTIVLRKLAAQARTRAELARALQSRAVPEEAATAVLDRMGEVGLVDDAAFARDWVASRQQRRHLSRGALRRELQNKGVDREVIDDALADVDGGDEHRAALDLASRRAGAMSGLPREVAYRRLGGVLARRGFSASVTARVLAEVLGGPGED